MSRVELKIYYKQNNVAKLRCVVNKWKFQDAMMGEQFITFTITSDKPIDWAVGDFCEFRGETFTLNYVPTVTQKARTKERQDAYTYENVKFESQQEELTRILMLDITPTTGDYVAALGTNYTGSSKFQLFCGETTANGSTLTAVCALAAKMQANLDRAFQTNGWKIFVDTTSTYVNASGDTVLVTHTEDKVMSFDNTTVAQALAEVHNTFDLDYCIRGRNIYIGYNLQNLTSDNANETFVFGYGKGYPTHEDSGKALFQIKRISNTQQKIVTRLRALGSTKNMPYRFYNKKYNLSQSLFPTNLQLPDTFASPSVKATNNAQRDSLYGINALTGLPYVRHVKGDTNDAYIDKNDDAENCAEGIREESARWDGSNGDLPEIYPTIEEATYGELRGALVQDQDGRTGVSSFPGYGADERVDELLAIGYQSDGAQVDDANTGDGILPESGTTGTGTPKSATIGQTSVRYNSRNYGDFTYNGGYLVGTEKTLFTVQNVFAGKYAMAPTIGAVFYGFSLSCYKEGVSADVGFRITIKQKSKSSGNTATVATYVSDFTHITQADNIKEMELPEIPDVKNGNNAKVSEIAVSELSDIIVTFAPIMRNVTVPNGFTDDFSLSYKVGNSRLGNGNNYSPEYTWISADGDESQEESFHVFIKDMGFDITACWTDETPVVAMKSGRCVGREFEIGENAEKVTYNGKKGYMLTLHRAKDTSLNTFYPSATDPIAAGDNFVLLNISMPDAYVKMAEVRLLRAATDYLADNCETQFTYQPYIDDIYLQRNYDNMVAAGTPQDSIFWRLYAGLKFTFRGIPSNENDPLPLADLTIEQVTIQMGEGLTPKVEMTLNDDVQQTTLQKLTTSVDRIYNGSLFSNGSGGAGTGANAAALLSILQSEGGKLFLSKKYDDEADGKITFKDVDTHEAMSKFKKGLKVGNFQSRLLGSGAIIDEDGNAEFESIYSRNFISTPEFRFNRIAVTEGEQWCTNGFGTILEVEPIDDTTGYITLKLEENDYASVAVGDICRGIYNDIASQYETATLDDDSALYGSDTDDDEEEEEVGIINPKEGTGFGFSCKDGFFTSYFWIKQMVVNKRGECKFMYELRNAKTPHPCEFMKFAQYGSFTNSQRRSSSYATSIGHYYEMVLDGVSTWKIKSANVVYRKGYLGNMTVTLRNGHEAELQGYGLYVQDNVYFGNAIVQLDPETLADIEAALANYTVEFSEHVDVITVDDVGNAIGGLCTVDGTTRSYRIQSAITVRNNNNILTIADDNEDAGDGTYKIYAQPNGCTCVIDNSTIYITGINNIKDGVAGSQDDTNFDYDAMRNMDSCSVDLIIDCEGKGSIVKSFPIRIKHDSQPFVSADIDNEFSAVSWNTQAQAYVGLPLVANMRMWHNNETLDVTSIAVNGVAGATINDSPKQITVGGITMRTGVVPRTENGKTYYIGRIQISSLPEDLSLVTNLNITTTAIYAGVPYERTLVHTINKSTDTNVYQLLPSVTEVGVGYNDNKQPIINTDKVYCTVRCDSTDDKHYTVATSDYATHGLFITYQTFSLNSSNVEVGGAETAYSSLSGVTVENDFTRIRFKLYKLRDTTLDTLVALLTPANVIEILDIEDVPVLLNGLDGDDGEDAHEVNPNILLRTVFNNGLDFVKEAWVSNWTYTGIDAATDTIIEGRKSIRINAVNTSSYVDFKQDVYGRVKAGTWYTLSFCYFATQAFNTFIYSNSNSYACIDQSAGIYIDGVLQSTVPQDGNVQWSANWQGNRHTITFKTKSSFDTTYFYIIFRAQVGGQVAICMPKLETGEAATAYMANEDDLPGSNYYLTSDVNVIVKDYLGNFKGSATPVITAWKKTGSPAATRLADIVVNGVVAEGFTIYEREMRGDTQRYEKTSSTGVLTCAQPHSDVDRIEVLLMKNNKTYVTMAIHIVQEVRGEAGADGVYPRDCGLFKSGNTYYYKKEGNMYVRDMVRYEIGGVMYGFLVKDTTVGTTGVTEAPTSASGDSNWEASGIVETVIANTIFGQNANIGGFMASAEMLRSSTPAYRVQYKGNFKAVSYGLYYQGTFQLGTTYYYQYYQYHAYSVYGAVFYNGNYYRRKSSAAPDTTKYPNQDTDHWVAFTSSDYDCISHPNEEYIIPTGAAYTYSEANESTPAIRPLVKYNDKYYVAKGNQLGKTFQMSSFSTSCWREAFDFEVGGIQNVGDTVDVPKFMLNGRTGTLIMRQADDTIYTYDEDGKQTTGYEDGRKVVIDPSTKSVSVYNDSGKQVITINGENKSSISSAYTGDSGSTSVQSGFFQKYALDTGAYVASNVLKALSNSFTISDGGWNFQIQASLSVAASYTTGNVWCADKDKNVLSYIQPITYHQGRSYGHQSYCKAEIVLVKEGGSTVVLATLTQGANGNYASLNIDKNMHIGSGTYYLALRYSYALYSNHSCSINYGAITASWAKDGYMGEIFANGLAFGNNAQNFFALIKESDTNIHLKLLSNNKYGIEINNTSIRVCINGTWYTLGVSGGNATLT